MPPEWQVSLYRGVPWRQVLLYISRCPLKTGFTVYIEVSPEDGFHCLEVSPGDRFDYLEVSPEVRFHCIEVTPHRDRFHCTRRVPVGVMSSYIYHADKWPMLIRSIYSINSRAVAVVCLSWDSHWCVFYFWENMLGKVSQTLMSFIQNPYVYRDNFGKFTHIKKGGGDIRDCNLTRL